MITFSGVLGIGFYTRSGIILRAAGPLALFLAFFILTALAWGVMQCITEMLSIWPVPGALVEFVRAFVDEDLATTVGIAYWYVLYSGLWSPHHSKLLRVVPSYYPSSCRMTSSRFTYAIAFPAFTTAIAGDLTPPKAIDGVILFFLVPVIIVFINSLGVRVCIIDYTPHTKLIFDLALRISRVSRWQYKNGICTGYHHLHGCY